MPNTTNREPEEESSGRPEFAFPSIARTLWKRKVVIISVWILLSLVAAAVVRELPAVYVAESLILVDSQRIPEKFVSATVAADLEQRITAIREQMLSSAALKQIISDFGLYRKERQTLFEEDIIELMRKDITIEFVETTLGAAKNAQPDAFRIGYQGRDPALVAKVANRLTDLCVDQNLKTREEQAAGTSEFLDTQVQEAKKRLDGLESAVTSYKLSNPWAFRNFSARSFRRPRTASTGWNPPLALTSSGTTRNCHNRRRLSQPVSPTFTPGCKRIWMPSTAPSRPRLLSKATSAPCRPTRCRCARWTKPGGAWLRRRAPRRLENCRKSCRSDWICSAPSILTLFRQWSTRARRWKRPRARRSINWRKSLRPDRTAKRRRILRIWLALANRSPR